MSERLLGGIEAGGTKWICLIGTGPDDVRAEHRFPTGDPGSTIGEAVGWFRRQRAALGEVTALGVASFGPVDLRPDSPAFGFITTTPKPGWSNTDVVGPLSAALDVPIGFDTDVNGAALGEGRWGAANGLDQFVYITVGTGIGGGAIVGGRPVHGLVHPEIGHVPVPRQAGDDYPGGCPFHGDCLEGMASGPAIGARWGRPASDLGDRADRAIDLEAAYLAAGIRTIVYTLAPRRVVIGGGVSELPGLIPAILEHLAVQLAGYPGLREHADSGFVVKAGLGGMAGPAGALVLAELALE